MAIVRRILFTLLGIVVAVVLAFAAYVASRQDVRFNPPAPHVAAAPDDTAAVERGRYLVENLVVCANCHGDPASKASVAKGERIALSGGGEWKIPPGNFYAPNITSDAATGIGAIPDSMIARAWRDGVRHDGRPLLPFMELQGLSDADLRALLSYVRTLPPVHHVVPAHQPNLLGRVVLATMLSKPVGPAAPPPAVSPAGATVENGRYLVESVAACRSCHTARDEKTGQFTGPRLGGARAQFEDGSNPKRSWSPPNLTRAPGVGRLSVFSEDAFVARFHAGRVFPGSPMPWESFRGMHEDDVRAIYRYLATIPPVDHDPGPPFVDKP
jgi:mono/diheme cytochrome c family protein